MLHEFTARLHGHATTGDNTWPDFTEDEGLNMFSSDGNTPTGIACYLIKSSFTRFCLFVCLFVYGTDVDVFHVM